MEAPKYTISCHCGAAAQDVTGYPEKDNPSSPDGSLDLCHCESCRHTTGLLCTSYVPISTEPVIQNLKCYESSPKLRRYFCKTCGCHIFQCRNVDDRSSWGVATGVVSEIKHHIADRHKDVKEEEEGARTHNAVACNAKYEPHYKRHVNVGGTKDGGLSPFITEIAGSKMEVHEHHGTLGAEAVTEHKATTPSAAKGDKGVLQAYCQCRTVRFHITRPDATSRLPHSGFPDLMIPFYTARPEIKNPEDHKWWLRPDSDADPTHYMAGTCACKSCRLISGFEIQTWAFIPKSNIIFHIRNETSDQEVLKSNPGSNLLPLDFHTLPPGILHSYESSPGVLREFCSNCGATVFWHDKWRPGIIDVSVGLLNSPDGARAEDWLDWWRDRVSFSEDAGNGRAGRVAEKAADLIEALETGLRSRA